MDARGGGFERSGDGPRLDPLADRFDLRAPRVGLPSFTLLELSEMAARGDGEVDAYERVLAQSARMYRAIELDVGALLAELTVGDKLARLGFSNVGDYAQNLLGMRRRSAQVAVQLAKGLRQRPLLRAAVYAGDVSPSAALVVLPVATGDEEERWVERAKVESVRRLAKLVKQARRERTQLPGPDAAEQKQEADARPWIRLRVPISDGDREDLDRALALAGELLGTPRRHAQLEALAAEYLSAHPGEEGDVERAAAKVELRLHPLDVPTKRDAAEAALELETSQWEFLDPVHPIAALDLDPDAYATPEELDATLVGLAQELKAWDDLIGHCAEVVKQTHTHRTLGFFDFRHYAGERLGVAARTVETRAALERSMRDRPELRVAKDMGLTYSKLLLLRDVPQEETLEWAMKAEKLTVVELGQAVRARVDAQMSARKTFLALMPRDTLEVLEQAFLSTGESARSRPLDGRFLGELSRHFLAAWEGEVTVPRTVSQKQRKRHPICCFPGCSRSSCHGHHIEYRSRGGSNDAKNRLPLCACHHLVVVHGGFARIFGRVPDDLEFFVNGVRWVDAKFGRNRAQRV